MPWSDEPGGGFTSAAATPWLPFGDLAACNVAAQRDDPGSVLHLVRDLIALRKRSPELTSGSYEPLPAPAGAWAWRRGERFVVALNLSDADVTVDGRRRAGRDRDRPRARRRRTVARLGLARLGRRTRASRECERRPGAASRRRGPGSDPAFGAGVPALRPLLSEEGWAYASLPPQEPGDPGRFHALFGRDSLITALQVLPAAPEVARATLRALAARQGRAVDAETDEEPGKILHEYRPVAARVVRRGRLAGARRRAPLLRHAPTRRAGSSSCSRRSATRGSRAELEPAWRAAAGWLGGALDAGGGLVRYGPRRGTGGLAQQGWRDAIAPVEHHPEGAGIVRPDGSEPAPPLADADCQAAAVAALDALARLDPGGGWARSARARAAGARTAASRLGGRRRGRWRSRATARPCRARARSSAGCCGRARSRARRPRPRPSGWSQPDVLTPFGLRTLSSEHPAFRPRAYHRGARLAVRLLARLGRAARRRPRRRRPSASARACSRRSTASAARPSSTPSSAGGELEPVPVANRVQAWTVGARWAFEHDWDGRPR